MSELWMRLRAASSGRTSAAAARKASQILVQALAHLNCMWSRWRTQNPKPGNPVRGSKTGRQIMAFSTCSAAGWLARSPIPGAMAHLL